MHADRDDELIAQNSGAFDDIDMAVGQGIEGTGIEGDADHGLSLERAIRQARIQFTPSFFCRLEEDVVYWNVSLLPG